MSVKKAETRNKARIVKSSILTQEKITRNQGNKMKTTSARQRTIPPQGTKETVIYLPAKCRAIKDVLIMNLTELTEMPHCMILVASVHLGKNV